MNIEHRTPNIEGRVIRYSVFDIHYSIFIPLTHITHSYLQMVIRPFVEFNLSLHEIYS